MNRTLEKRLGKERVFLLETLYQARGQDEMYDTMLKDIVEQSDMYSDVEVLKLDFTHYQLMRPKNRIEARIQDNIITSREINDFELLLKSAQLPMTLEERRNYIDNVVERQGYENREELWTRYEQWQRGKLEDGN